MTTPKTIALERLVSNQSKQAQNSILTTSPGDPGRPIRPWSPLSPCKRQDECFNEESKQNSVATPTGSTYL